MLDLNRLRDADVRSDPYPFFSASNVFTSDMADRVAADFPTIDRAGAVDVDEAEGGPAFNALLEELRGEPFRKLIAEKFDVDLSDREIVINVRGQMRLTDGNIHTDTPSKLVTVLLYFNRPGEVDHTGLRILRNGHDLDNVVEEIPPHLGTLMAFKVTPDCWHGHRAIEGPRRSLQLNYLSGIKTRGKHQLAHRIVGRMKRKVAHLFAGG